MEIGESHKEKGALCKCGGLGDLFNISVSCALVSVWNYAYTAAASAASAGCCWTQCATACKRATHSEQTKKAVAGRQNCKPASADVHSSCFFCCCC
jgi:hypothetical protein